MKNQYILNILLKNLIKFRIITHFMKIDSLNGICFNFKEINQKMMDNQYFNFIFLKQVTYSFILHRL